MEVKFFCHHLYVTIFTLLWKSPYSIKFVLLRCAQSTSIFITQCHFEYVSIPLGSSLLSSRSNDSKQLIASRMDDNRRPANSLSGLLISSNVLLRRLLWSIPQSDIISHSPIFIFLDRSVCDSIFLSGSSQRIKHNPKPYPPSGEIIVSWSILTISLSATTNQGLW